MPQHRSRNPFGISAVKRSRYACSAWGCRTPRLNGPQHTQCLGSSWNRMSFESIQPFESTLRSSAFFYNGPTPVWWVLVLLSFGSRILDTLRRKCEFVGKSTISCIGACAFLGQLNGLLVAASWYGCVSQVLQWTQWLKEGLGRTNYFCC